MDQLSKSLGQMMGTVNVEFRWMESLQQLDELITFTIMIANRCKERFQRLIQALTSIHNEPNFPVLVKPETLWKELQNIENQKRSEISLPLDLKRDTLYHYYNIGAPKVGIVGAVLIIKFEIPLTNTQTFNIFKITPVPMRIEDNLFSILVPEHELVALSEDRGSFADISESELNHCIKIPTKGFACPDLMIFRTDSNPSCETAILTNNTKLMSVCQNRVLRIETELWLTLQSKSSWIYSINKPTIAEISTEHGKKFQTELKDSGIITLVLGSRLETISVKIRAPATRVSEVEIKFVAGSQVPIFDFNTTEMKI